MKQGFVYILTNYDNSVLYVGVTSNLIKRIFEHKNRLCDGFTSRYHLTKLIYYESIEDMSSAIAREKQIKGGSRKKKVGLVESMNPEWKDLYDDIVR